MKGKFGRKKKKIPCLNLKIKMLMRFLFQKHILLIKGTQCSRLTGGPGHPPPRAVGPGSAAEAGGGWGAQRPSAVMVGRAHGRTQGAETDPVRQGPSLHSAHLCVRRTERRQVAPEEAWMWGQVGLVEAHSS